MRYLLIGVVVIGVALAGGYYYLANFAGETMHAGEPEGTETPPEVVEAREAAQAQAAAALDVADPKQILFGDLHVHTTFSTDAFLWALPMNSGPGAHPLADACDFARHCSALDFWSITDHAEASTPRRWQEAKDTIRQCNAVAGDPDDPDMVSFMGFEWTQVGATPDEHFGHKNVIFRGLEDDEVSPRAIGAGGVATDALRGSIGNLPVATAIVDWSNREPYLNFREYMRETRDVPMCDEGVPSNELDPACYESADTPGDLARKLFDELELDPLIIPHGTAWGFYTPTGTTLDKQLKADMRPEKQELIEVMSGHGNSEEYRPWRAATIDADGNIACPAPSYNYVPSCWRGGEIIRARCEAAGEDDATCDTRAREARQNFAQLSIAGHMTISGEDSTEYLDAGQCRDCFLPPFNHRPGTSVQYGMAISNLDDPDNPRRFNWGFIASSDTHRARPGTGYKAVDRENQSDARGPRSQAWMDRQRLPQEEPLAQSIPLTQEDIADVPGFQLVEFERQGSFWTAGGLAAVHSEGRDRDAIFDALKRRETYGTSGPRMLLWFDMIEPANAPAPAPVDETTAGSEAPDADVAAPAVLAFDSEPVVVASMGATVESDVNPTFRVRAVGAFKQKPGCPDHAGAALPEDRFEMLCRGECYNPTDTRNVIDRIEIIRIRPQIDGTEDVADLVDDAFITHQCEADESGCSFTFTDPEYAELGRDTLYYARAVQEKTPAINGANLRCDYDDDGNCIKVNPCYADFRTAPDDACLADVGHRAWSSPIYVNWRG
ncbi:DUF3604 domain-containing protein [Pyruvatibacter sp.]|uniref:DUF3604 domain-containing protein n=1 Tax=Pyruvatibacter sp. TaxID=1981328 RepID=UPI0032EEFCC5